MDSKIISLLYRKIITEAAQDPWEKTLFQDSYKEFIIQAQTFNAEKKYFTYAELIQHMPGSDKLNFLVSGSVTGCLKQLNGIIPYVTSNTGRRFVPFKRYRFEIINSDIREIAKHQIGINFISEPLNWHDTINNQLLISVADNNLIEQDEFLTEIITMQPYLSIYSLKEKKNNDHANKR